MSARRITLPAPHAAILCHAERMRWGYYVEYLAPSVDALLAAGCITPAMHSELLKPARIRDKVEANGDKFYCKPRPIKSQPHRCRLARYISAEGNNAMAGAERTVMLPGVREALRLSRNPEARRTEYRGSLGDRSTVKRLPWLDRAAQETTRCLGLDVTVTERSRSLGRQQRPVTWATVGNLVVIPNWVGIRAAVEAARGAA